MENLTQNKAKEILITDKEKALFSDTVNKHRDRLYSVIHKYIENAEDVADLAQQACMIGFKSLPNFRGDSELSAWLYGIAFNVVRGYLHLSQHKYRFENEEILLGISSNKIDPNLQINLIETLLTVQSHLDALPIQIQTMLEMFTIDEMSIEEIAEALNIPIGTVKSRLSRTRYLLNTALRDSGVEIF